MNVGDQVSLRKMFIQEQFGNWVEDGHQAIIIMNNNGEGKYDINKLNNEGENRWYCVVDVKFNDGEIERGVDVNEVTVIKKADTTVKAALRMRNYLKAKVAKRKAAEAKVADTKVAAAKDAKVMKPEETKETKSVTFKSEGDLTDKEVVEIINQLNEVFSKIYGTETTGTPGTTPETTPGTIPGTTPGTTPGTGDATPENTDSDVVLIVSSDKRLGKEGEVIKTETNTEKIVVESTTNK
jgi:hypothetical protein